MRRIGLLLMAACACSLMSHARAEDRTKDSTPPASVVVPVQPAAISGKPDPEAIDWLPSRGPECIKRGPNRRFCQGPRRVPTPHGPAEQLAKELGLGERRGTSLLLLGPPQASWIEAAARAPRAAQWLWPVEDGKLLRGLGRSKSAALRNRKRGARKAVRYHEGVDIGAAEGNSVYAAQGGLVVYSDNGVRGYGNLIVVVHADGSVALYAHCRATYVFPGEHVTQGQTIAEVGHTGYARGSHLHFEYRVDGAPKDPTPLFADRP